MNGLTVLQMRYNSKDFNEDLWLMLRRSGCKDKKIRYIMGEFNVMDPSFLKRMNMLCLTDFIQI